MIVGGVFLHEPLTLRVLLGSLTVVGGVAIATRTRRAREGPAAEGPAPERPPGGGCES
jgi:drug/metabolite transporter (DMT)-like permease